MVIFHSITLLLHKEELTSTAITKDAGPHFQPPDCQ